MLPALVAHLDMTHPGGGSAVLAWSLAALAQHYAVSVVTLRPLALAELDARFGTSLAGRSIAVIAPPVALQRAMFGAGARAERMKTLALGMLARRTRRRLGAALALSTCNELDLGGAAVQYVHYPLASYRSALSTLAPSRRARAAAYLALTELPWRRELARSARNLTLCNSEYTRRAYRLAHGRDAVVLHPPVQSCAWDTPWRERAQRVVCLGRFAPEKRLLEAVEVVERVRQHGIPLELELIGTRDHGATLRTLQCAARDRRWLRVLTELDRARLWERLRGARYGLHMAVDEHFGIAVGELISAGCVVLAHRSAGPLEILDHERLLFSDVEQATRRLLALIRNEDVALTMQTHCMLRAGRFSERAFMEGLLAHCTHATGARTRTRTYSGAPDRRAGQPAASTRAEILPAQTRAPRSEG